MEVTKQTSPLPFIGNIAAGFPSPATDFVETGIDLHQLLIRHPSSTFFARVQGESMRDAGLHNGCLVIIDRSLDPKDGDIALCAVDGEFTLKRLSLHAGHCYLMPANHDYKPIRVTAENSFMIWGIVTHSINAMTSGV